MVMSTNHRPFPLPRGPWIMKQNWEKVLFSHWRVDYSALRQLVPNQLEIDTFKGEAWISIIPFMLTNLRGRMFPPIPVMSSFPELNLRTYVTFKGKPAIYFFSLDASQRLAVLSARNLFHLPYYHANMQLENRENEVHFSSERIEVNSEKANFKAAYRPNSESFTSEKGSLDYWLTERYRLYTTHKQKLYYLDIHHKPWQLQQAKATLIENTVPQHHQLILSNREPLFHFSEKQEVLFWRLKREK